MPEFDKENNNPFAAEHFEGLGDKWAAIVDDTSQMIAYCISTTAKEGEVAASAKVLIDGTARGVLLMQYPEKAPISAGLLLLTEPQGKNLDVTSVFPMFEGQTNRLTIGDSFI